MNKEKHWENIYKTKELTEVSWYEPVPQISLNLLKNCEVPFDAKIIDVGGGDSFFVDNLLKLGYLDITVLDISSEAILRAKKRLEGKAQKVNWIVSDIIDFKPDSKYDFWYDRAAFHFLTDEDNIKKYLEAVKQGVSDNGILVIGTFSEDGPTKCSGIEVKQYSETSLKEQFSTDFEMIDSFTIDHKTPFETFQNFAYGVFKKRTLISL
ncbi:class I SAM-dependent methyltransferase [Flavobacterium collinsii]|uniref:class I SAM-dependent methyltransferase n=1 Tax=Flavobacterium collinsii TaxID=1114861 RepID=UPI0037571FAF